MANSADRVVIHSPLDMHLHFREGAMAQTVIPLSSAEIAVPGRVIV